MSLLDKLKRKKPSAQYVLRQLNEDTAGRKKIAEIEKFISPDQIEEIRDGTIGGYVRLEEKKERGYGQVVWYYPEQPPSGGKASKGLGIRDKVDELKAVKDDLAALSALFKGESSDHIEEALKLQAKMYGTVMEKTIESVTTAMSPFAAMYGMPEDVAKGMPKFYWMMRDKKAMGNLGDTLKDTLNQVFGADNYGGKLDIPKPMLPKRRARKEQSEPSNVEQQKIDKSELDVPKPKPRAVVEQKTEEAEPSAISGLTVDIDKDVPNASEVVKNVEEKTKEE